MSGTYAAAMEGHTSAWYVSEWLRIGGTNLPPAAIALGTSYVKHARGVLRAMCESVDRRYLGFGMTTLHPVVQMRPYLC